MEVYSALYFRSLLNKSDLYISNNLWKRLFVRISESYILLVAVYETQIEYTV